MFTFAQKDISDLKLINSRFISHNYPDAMLRSVQYEDAGGFIPSSVINMKIPHQLMQVKRAIDKFSRNDEVSIE